MVPVVPDNAKLRGYVGVLRSFQLKMSVKLVRSIWNFGKGQPGSLEVLDENLRKLERLCAKKRVRQ